MSLPLHDWQFWVVTLAALVAAGWLLRGVLPGLRGRAKRRKQQHKATLTISAKSGGGQGGDRPSPSG